jgi:Rod binding domain-containing protein
MDGLPITAPDAQHFMALKKTDASAISSLKRKSDVGSLKGKADDADELREAAKQFEAVFMSQLLKQMRSTVHKEEMFHGGAGEDIFTEMLDEEFAQKMSVRGTGIADMLYLQLSRQFGIGETETDHLPSPTGSGDLLQQKLQDMQQQIQNKEPQPMSVNI